MRPYHARPLPRYRGYRPYYSRYWVHPWYRYTYSTYVVVSFGFAVDPWGTAWVPPSRTGWVWVPGFYNVYGYWVPGYWEPARQTVVVYSDNSYVYVPGYWQDEVYVEGYYRVEARSDGDWEWIEGYYLEDGTAIPGHWVPSAAGPDGYTWEPGFFDGETWVEGFWRPEYRAGFVWISSWYDDDGIYNAGYWEPTEASPGEVWIPGWFDGTEWVEGYWIDEAEYSQGDIDTWEPEEGWHDGWDPESGDLIYDDAEEDYGTVPLAMPVMIDEEALE